MTPNIYHYSGEAEITTDSNTPSKATFDGVMTGQIVDEDGYLSLKEAIKKDLLKNDEIRSIKIMSIKSLSVLQ